MNNCIAVNVNDTIMPGDSIVIKIAKMAEDCQAVTNDIGIGGQIAVSVVGIIVIFAACIFVINRFINTKLWFDRLLSKNLWKQFAILGIGLIISFLLSWYFLHISGCKWEDFCESKNLSEWLLPLYLLIDSNALNHLYTNCVNGWALFVSSIIYVIGMFVFNGMIISIMTNAIERRVENHSEGYIHYLKSGHHIIMGYDDMVPSIISHIFEKDKKAFILILTSAKVTEIREKLLKSFDKETMKHIILNYGHRTSADSYKDIYVESAEQIFIVGNHANSAHDAINVECVDSICRYLNKPKVTQRPNRITCVFKDLDTYAAFKTSEIFKEVGKLEIEFVPYNFYTGCAKQVFIKRKYKDIDSSEIDSYNYPCVYGKGITPEDDKYVHLVFVGTTNFAVAFAMEAAHVLHFPNADKAKTRITFIDKNADIEKDEFITRNRHFFDVQSFSYYDLSNDKRRKEEAQGIRNEYVQFKENNVNFLDVEFEFIKGDIFSKKVQDKIAEWSKEHNDKQYLSIFLALADQRQNFVLGMNMPDEVYDNAIPLFIRQDRSDNFVTNLRNADIKEEGKELIYATVNKGIYVEKKRNARYANIYPFGMNETAFCADNHSLKRAKLINYLYCTANYETHKFQSILALDAMSEENIWYEADRHWKKLTVALKWSNLYSAYAIKTKLATLRVIRGLDIEDATHDYQLLSDYEAEIMAKIEHNRWNVEKLLMGYRKAHEEEDKYNHDEYSKDLAKNKKLFIHHDIRPYDELDSIQELDKEFSRYIPWIMKMTEEAEEKKRQK